MTGSWSLGSSSSLSTIEDMPPAPSCTNGRNGPLPTKSISSEARYPNTDIFV